MTERRPSRPRAPAKPLTLIVSDDEFLASAALARVREPLRAKGWAAEERGADAQSLMYSLETPSLFDQGRLVVVPDADALKADAVAAIRAWAASTPEGTRLVLVARKGAALRKALGDAADVIDAPAPKPWETARWLFDHARSLGARITREAAQALVDAVGTDLRELDSAFRQLLLATGGSVDVPAVAAQFQGLESQVYTFVDLVVERNAAAALRHLHALLAHGEHPLVLVSALARRLRALGLARGADRLGAAAISKELGMTENQVRRTLQRGAAFDDADIARAFRLLAEADLSLKGGETGFEDEPPEMVMELLVAEIAGGAGKPGARAGTASRE